MRHARVEKRHYEIYIRYSSIFVFPGVSIAAVKMSYSRVLEYVQHCRRL